MIIGIYETWRFMETFSSREMWFITCNIRTGHEIYVFYHNGPCKGQVQVGSQVVKCEPKKLDGWKLVLFSSKLFCFYDLSGADPGFGQGGGPQLLRPKVADIAKRSPASEASILRPGSRARLRALEAFGFLMLKYAFSHILETLFLLFLTSILTPKVYKNRALDFTSINLRHSDMLHLFFNLHEKVML